MSVCSPLVGWGGTLSQVWVRRYPVPGLGVGVPHPRSGWGAPGVPPSQVWMVGGTWGTPLARSGWWGDPILGLGVGGTWGTQQARSWWWRVPWVPPPLWLDGVPPSPPPPSWLDGVPHPCPIRQSSIVSTCYAACGMPLAFMLEDFLVTLYEFLLSMSKIN